MSHSYAQRGLRRLLAALVATGVIGWASPVIAQGGGVSSADYRVTFQGNWTLDSTPDGVVSDAHFTTRVGAVHGADVTFWQSGGRASPGVEQVAETGATSRFRSEIEASPHVAAVIRQGIPFGGTGRATFSIDIASDHPRVTLLSMIGPSPDWFVGIAGRSLLDASGRWAPRVEIDLFPYDAGTEDGDEFSLANPATVPQGVIRSIRGTGKFSNEPMAQLTFVLTSTETRPAVSLSASPNPVDEGGPVTVTATLLEALTDDVTIPLMLTAGTAEPGDYSPLESIAIAGGSITGTGEIATADDADHDDETFTVALDSLPSSVAAGTPSSVEVTIRDAGPAPPARPGRPVVAPGASMLEVSWTPVPGAESYTVQWRSGSEGYSDTRQQTIATPSATLSGLTNGVDYTVRVRAGYAGGDSDWSEEATGTPFQPEVSLSASPNPVDEGGPVTVSATLSQALADEVTIPLTLTAGTAEPDDYGPLESIAIAAGSTTGTGEVTTADDADHDDETFTVALGSLPSSVAAGAPSSVEVTIRDAGPAPPARPARPAVTPGDATLEVSWAAVPGAESYAVQWRSGSQEYAETRQQTVETPSATLSGLTNGVAYTVRVRASNAGGDSAWSEEATETPLQPVPALPAAGAGLLGLLLALLGGRRPGGSMPSSVAISMVVPDVSPAMITIGSAVKSSAPAALAARS